MDNFIDKFPSINKIILAEKIKINYFHGWNLTSQIDSKFISEPTHCDTSILSEWIKINSCFFHKILEKEALFSKMIFDEIDLNSLKKTIIGRIILLGLITIDLNTNIYAQTLKVLVD